MKHASSAVKKNEVFDMKKFEEVRQLPPLEMQRLGQLMKEYRVNSLLGLEELSSLAQVNLSQLVGMEMGQVSLPLKDLFTLCNYLNVPPSALMKIVHGL